MSLRGNAPGHAYGGRAAMLSQRRAKTAFMLGNRAAGPRAQQDAESACTGALTRRGHGRAVEVQDHRPRAPWSQPLGMHVGYSRMRRSCCTGRNAQSARARRVPGLSGVSVVVINSSLSGRHVRVVEAGAREASGRADCCQTYALPSKPDDFGHARSIGGGSADPDDTEEQTLPRYPQPT